MKVARGVCAALAQTTAVALLAGCGALTAPADDGQLRVVASFYPLQYVAQRIAGDRVQVTNLTSPGAEPHDLELTVPQTAELTEADVVVYESGMQPAVDDAVDQNGPEHVVDASDVLHLEPIGHGTENADDHGATDLHFWLDPTRVASLAVDVKRQLVEVDPDHARVYERNLMSLENDLDDLDRDYHHGLAGCALDTVVVSHDAFGYLGKYGLRFEAINGLSPDAEPSAAHIAQLQDLIEAEGITTVFSETLASKQMSQSIAHDLGLRAAVLDPIEGLSDATADEDYLSLMRQNLAELREANQCR